MIVRCNGEGSPTETDYEIFTSTTKQYTLLVSRNTNQILRHMHMGKHRLSPLAQKKIGRRFFLREGGRLYKG